MRSSLQNLAVPHNFYSPVSISVERSCQPCIQWCMTSGFQELGQCLFICPAACSDLLTDRVLIALFPALHCHPFLIMLKKDLLPTSFPTPNTPDTSAMGHAHLLSNTEYHRHVLHESRPSLFEHRIQPTHVSESTACLLIFTVYKSLFFSYDPASFVSVSVECLRTVRCVR